MNQSEPGKGRRVMRGKLSKTERFANCSLTESCLVFNYDDDKNLNEAETLLKFNNYQELLHSGAVCRSADKRSCKVTTVQLAQIKAVSKSAHDANFIRSTSPRRRWKKCEGEMEQCGPLVMFADLQLEEGTSKTPTTSRGFQRVNSVCLSEHYQFECVVFFIYSKLYA
ncbi:hypothetical protein JOB18_007609 [Solea senegalensis]|uniref:Uncharacterized protein n=1 Tax=Solea senegalensis TaxID=28829 RepID=A0AAV6R1F0_SOLSE|nr:hypothetical protein JOB18_007609 [Solea senegalensis]